MNIIKVIQVVGILLKNDAPKTKSSYRLMRLLYLVERTAIKERGFGLPMIGGEYFATKHGPVLSVVGDLIKKRGAAKEQKIWDEHFKIVGPTIEAIKDAGVGQLSKNDVLILEGVIIIHKRKPFYKMVEEAREFSEWKENKGSRIPLESIICAVGRSADCDAILAEIKRTDKLDKFFSSLS